MKTASEMILRPVHSADLGTAVLVHEHGIAILWRGRGVSADHMTADELTELADQIRDSANAKRVTEEKAGKAALAQLGRISGNA